MKIRPFVKVISLALVISQAAYALHNGKPFKAINTLIQGPVDVNDENSAIIEKKSDVIFSLSRELSALGGRVVTQETDEANDFGLLKIFATKNTNERPLSLEKKAEVQVHLTAIEEEVALNTKAIDQVDLAIIVTNGKIDGLTKAIAILNDTIVINTAAITEIEGKIIAAARKKTNKHFDDLNASLSSYEAIVDINFSQIAENEAEIAIAQSDLDALTTKYYELVTVVDKNAQISGTAISELKLELPARHAG